MKFFARHFKKISRLSSFFKVKYRIFDRDLNNCVDIISSIYNAILKIIQIQRK